MLAGVYSSIALTLLPWFRPVLPLVTVMHVGVYANFVMLSRPRMRPLWYRLVISWPSSFFVAGTLLALPWALIAALGFHPWGVWMPYAWAVIGLYQSFTTKKEKIDLVVPGSTATPAR